MADLPEAFAKALRDAKNVKLQWTESPELGLTHINPQLSYDLLPDDVRERVSLDDYKTIWLTQFAIWVTRQMRIQDQKQAIEIAKQLHVLADLKG